MQIPLRTLIFPLLLTLGACANQQELSSGLGVMRTGVAHMRTSTDDAFTELNSSRRDFAIEDVLDANRAPTEADFASLIDPDTTLRWRKAYDAVDGYLAALQTLVDTKRSEQTRAGLEEVGTGVQALGIGLPTGAQTAFSAFGGAVVQAAAERKAMTVIRRVDPSFRRLMITLGDLVAGPDEGTLRALTVTQWKRRLQDIAADDYTVAAAQGSRERREAVVRAYRTALDERDAKLGALADLRDALLALGEAHGAAARGGDGAVIFWIGQIEARLKDVRDAIGKGA